jgi:uncharacterized protein (UPF0333 family)
MAINLLDITSNNNDLTNNGATEVTASLPFAASTIAIDVERSSSQYLSITDAAQTGLDLTNNFTLEAWIKPENVNGDTQIIMGKFSSSPQLSFAWGIAGIGASCYMRFYYTTNGDWATFNDFASSTFGSNPQGTWVHCAVTFASGTVSYYVNGSAKGTSSGASSIYSGTAPFEIGRENSNYFDGSIDECRVWNVVRTGTQINDNKSVRLTGSESGLVAYWPWEVLSQIKGVGGVAYSGIKKISSAVVASVKKVGGLA